MSEGVREGRSDEERESGWCQNPFSREADMLIEFAEARPSVPLSLPHSVPPSHYLSLPDPPSLHLYAPSSAPEYQTAALQHLYPHQHPASEPPDHLQ